jgi:NAD(P)-dependent dehydrogenase (short-subunit alcohol dehydrogenase family)
MTEQKPGPILEGKKALIVGIANESSIAYGCAKAFRDLKADLAITYLNDNARRFVEPLAQELEAPIFLPLDVAVPGQLEHVFDAIASKWGRLDILVHSIAFAPKDDLQGGLLQLLGERLRHRDGCVVPFVRAHGEARCAVDARRRHDVRDVVSRREQGRPHLQRHGTRQGRAGSMLPLPRL